MIANLKEAKGVSHWSYIWLFIITAIFGCFISWFTPLFSIPDENAHYLRSFEVSRGGLLNSVAHTGVDISCESYLIIAKKYAPIAFFQADAEKSTGGSCYVKSINTAGTYPPIPYIASAIGIRLSELFNYDVETSLKFGRMANALLTSLICLFSILNTNKNYRLLLTSFSLLPTTLWLRSSLSADAITLVLCIAFFAAILRFIEDEKVSWRSLIVLSVLAVLLGSSKPVYSLLSFVSLILFKKSSSLKEDMYSIGKLLIPSFLAILISLFWIISANPKLIYINTFNGANPELQIHFLLNSPFKIIEIIYKTIDNNLVYLLGQELLPTLASANWISLNSSLFLASIIITLLFFGAITTPTLLKIWQRCFLLVLAIGVSLVIMLPLYITYTLVGHNEVLGLQGRYFLPVLFLALIAVCHCTPNFLYASVQARCIVFIVIPNLVSLFLFVYYIIQFTA